MTFPVTYTKTFMLYSLIYSTNKTINRKIELFLLMVDQGLV